MKAVLNAIGGLLPQTPLDNYIGKDGFFPENNKNRQLLRKLKKLGVPLFTTSSRGAVWDLKSAGALFPDVDSFWRNPRSEAGKIAILRDQARQVMRANDEAIANPATSPKLIQDYTKNNRDFEHLLNMIGSETQQAGGQTTISNDAEYDALPSGTVFTGPDGVTRRKP